MHGLKRDALVKLFTPLFINLFQCGSQPVSGGQIFVNIQNGFALICRLCLRIKDKFAEDVLHSP